MLDIQRRAARAKAREADRHFESYERLSAEYVATGDEDARAAAAAEYASYQRLLSESASIASSATPYESGKLASVDAPGTASPAPTQQQHDHARTIRTTADAYDPFATARDAMDAYMSLLDSSDTASNAEVVEELLARHSSTPHETLAAAVARQRRNAPAPRAAPRTVLAVDADVTETSDGDDPAPPPQPAPVSVAPRPTPSPSPVPAPATEYDVPPRAKRTEASSSRDTSPPPRGESIWDWASRPAAGHADIHRAPRPSSSSPGPATDVYALWQATHGGGGK